MDLACQSTGQLSWRCKLLRPLLIDALLHVIVLAPAGVRGQEERLTVSCVHHSWACGYVGQGITSSGGFGARSTVFRGRPEYLSTPRAATCEEMGKMEDRRNRYTGRSHARAPPPGSQPRSCKLKSGAPT
ncbi:hypothetical protein PUN4_180079 [Paraburkholderia unamae]|nr:hypothetical protein PUN4_180079 [Paraburkholderia unamae]